MGEDSFLYQKDGVSLKCQGDKVRCADFFKEQITKQQDPNFVQKDSVPPGDVSEGTFTIKNGRDYAEGTLDFMKECVNRNLLEMTPENYQITPDNK